MNSLLRNAVGLLAVFFAGWSGVWSHGVVSGLSNENSIQVDEIRARRLVILDEAGEEVGHFYGHDKSAVLQVGALNEESTRVLIEANNMGEIRYAQVTAFQWDEGPGKGTSQATLFVSEKTSRVLSSRREKVGYERGLALRSSSVDDTGVIVAIADGKEVAIPWPLKRVESGGDK